jgi:hypothetical protein
LDYVHAEVSAFPKGHVAIATSWALPTSECSLHSCFGENCRGPVRFHTDLDREIDESTVVAVETPLADINEKSTPLAEDAQETE